MGARGRLPAHRHGTGLRERGERRSGPARQRRAARRGVPDNEVLPGLVRPGGGGREERAAARRGAGRPLSHPLAAARPHLGVAGDGARARARPGAFDRDQQLRRGRGRGGDERGHRGARGQPDPVQPLQAPAHAARGLRGAWRGARGIQPADARPRPRRQAARGDRREQGTHPRAGPPALGRAAQHPRDPEVEAPRADRGERADLRLRALDETGGTARALEDKWW